VSKAYKHVSFDENQRAQRVIRARRIATGLTPDEVAQALGVSRAFIYRWENGRIPYTAVKLINYLTSERFDADKDEDGRGVFYWFLRAQAAEHTLKRIQKTIEENAAEVGDLDA